MKKAQNKLETTSPALDATRCYAMPFIKISRNPPNNVKHWVNLCQSVCRPRQLLYYEDCLAKNQ